VLAAVGFAALSFTHGQEPATLPVASTPAAGTAASTPARPPLDLAKLSPLQQQMYLCAQRGSDWLRRANRPDGHFIHGYLPALKTPLEGDHYLRQVGAAFALARAARFLGDERYAAVVRQALLTLLLDTTTDSQQPQLRHTTLPSVLVNRLAAAGLLLLAINELPAPGEDLLEQSEQLCAYIRSQQGRDGSLSYVDAEAQVEADPDGINHYPGEALYGLMLSQRHRPAAWKTECVRKALAYYRTWRQDHKSPTFVAWQTAAYAEAFALTKEQPFAEFVNEMNDWLVGLQYAQLDARHPLWVGGFREWTDGKALSSAPQVHSALYAESLAQACRVARQAGDVARYQRNRDALERTLQFLTTLQYTDGNTQHFADWYRPALVGAFYASHQDGNIRIDYTQHGVCAMVDYLTFVGG
jgi:hypothetical protein